jgi:hypothetical protein
MDDQIVVKILSRTHLLDVEKVVIVRVNARKLSWARQMVILLRILLAISLAIIYMDFIVLAWIKLGVSGLGRTSYVITVSIFGFLIFPQLLRSIQVNS